MIQGTYPISLSNSHPKLLVFLLISCYIVPNVRGAAPWADRRVTPNHQPKLNDQCDFMLYKHYFRGVRDCSSQEPYSCSTGEKDALHSLATLTEPKFMDPKFLCIKTDSNYNLDMNEFDCLPDTTDYRQINGYCGCGSRFSQIDFNDRDAKSQLNGSTYSYEYPHFPSLHKGLTMQKRSDGTYECVASQFNHCTLKESSGKHKTECLKGFVCLNVSVTHPAERQPFQNSRTGEWYGICLNPNAEAIKEDPFSNFAWRKENGFCRVLVCICIICQFVLLY
ncbi:hypothetical protein Ocin01_14818 [Orchesella cincta]|uniref:Uncharacterized protein n=1 Tax=Orchesella cincta TaxID=48709 RepID=A0A1D2MG71_ORCCI|nr:hypothetical protein Ocin01_14818 [Orchesella cincta]